MGGRFAEDDKGLAEPCYLRTIFVRAVDDVFDVVSHCTPHTQTIGLAVDNRARIAGGRSDREGVERCPAVGVMRILRRPLGWAICDGPDGKVGEQVIVVAARRR